MYEILTTVFAYTGAIIWFLVLVLTASWVTGGFSVDIKHHVTKGDENANT